MQGSQLQISLRFQSQGYLAPHKIDPKLLDVKHVFEEMDKDEKPASVFKDPATRKPKALVGC